MTDHDDHDDVNDEPDQGGDRPDAGPSTVHEGVRVLAAEDTPSDGDGVAVRRRPGQQGFGDRPDRPAPRPDLPTVTISTSDDEHPTRRTLPGERFGAVPVVRVDGPAPDTIEEDHPGHARLVHDEAPGSIGMDAAEVAGMTADDERGAPDDGYGLSDAPGTEFDESEDAFVLPHWTEPPTGQVPKTVIAEGEEAEPVTGSQPRWRDERERGAETDFDDLRSDGPQLGALAGQTDQGDPDDFFSGEAEGDPFLAFAPDDESGQPERVSRRRRSEPEAERPSALSRVRAGLGRRGEADGGDRADVYGDVDVDEPGDDRGFSGESEDQPDDDDRRSGVPAPTGGAGGSGGDRNLVTAVAVGVALVAIGLVCFKLGGLATTVLACVVVGAAAIEYFTAVQQRGFRPATLVGVVGILGLLLATYFSGLAAFPVVLPLTIVIGLLWFLWVAPGERSVINLGVTLLGFMWIGLLGSFATLFLGLGRQMQAADPSLTSNPGIGVLIAAVIASVASDVGGYFVGKYMGRTQLSAASPNKTQEGLIGGFVAALVAVVVVVGFFGIAPIGGSFPRVFIFALLCALVAPLGDLCESFVKRDLGIKDMGTVLPAHGGVLDRFDGLLFVLPVAYFVTVLFDVWSIG
jgi:phosphatidate cytidylyltransferase